MKSLYSRVKSSGVKTLLDSGMGEIVGELSQRKGKIEGFSWEKYWELYGRAKKKRNVDFMDIEK